MLNNKLKVLIVGVVVSIVVSVGFIGTGLLKELSSARIQNEDYKKSIEYLEQQNQKVTEENSKVNKEKENVIKEKEKLQEEFDNINKLYKKELEPVSYNSSNLLSSSKCTINKLSKGIKGTGLEGLESAYLEAEETYGVNAIFLIALTAQESSWGKSYRAMNQNNMSGYAVYSDSAKGRYFNSKQESIMETAKLIKQDYLSNDGKYHNGYSATSVNIRYCPDDNYHWSNNINKIANDLVDKINSR